MKKLFFSFVCALTITNAFAGNALLSAYAGNYENVTTDFSEIEITFDDISLNFSDMPAILSNESEFTYNFRDQLDKNNGAVYDALSVITTPTTDKITAVLPEPVTITVNHVPSSSNYNNEDAQIFNNAVFSNCKNGIDSLLLDMPEIFWLDEAKLAIGIGNSKTSRDWLTGKYKITINSLTFKPAYHEAYGSLDGVNEYKLKLENAVENFPVEGENRCEQLKSIHNYICEFTYYDVDADFYSSAVGAIVEPGVVCEGYSKSFKLICDRLDIPCVLVFGNFNDEERTAHMWNYVQMEDEKWYAVDVTWDDLDGKNGKEFKNDYFLKGSESFNKNHFENGVHDYTNIVYPKISETDYQSGEPIITSTTTTTTTTTATTSTTEPEKLIGDLNKDGKVNIADLVYCSNAVMGKETEFSCDFNEDGFTDSFDIVLMRKIVTEK
ncbi:MAG: hypothetical protein K2J32_00030 [Ruminococcus sp.]|nr:hypothetical protein [Ruminococcus sp.]